MRQLILVFSLGVTPAIADVTSPSGKTVECYCTDSGGARIELGQSICLRVDGRMFTARCEMSQNVPMWREMQNGCLSSSLGQKLFGAGEQPLQSFAVDADI
jgi:hypothetical protein